MKFHIQEHVVIRDERKQITQHGSCYPTVIACVLDLELNQVPYFHLTYWTVESRGNITRYLQNRFLDGKPLSEFDGEKYKMDNFHHFGSLADCLWDNIKTFWLASIGYEDVYTDDIDQWLKDNPDTPYFASGKSSRGVDHIVIYRNGVLYHDPHPSGEGLVSLWEHPFQYLKPI